MMGKKMGKMDIDHFYVNVDDNTITGKGSDPVGEFTIAGSKREDGQYSFMKRYVGAHVVCYQGGMDKEGKITGNWVLPNGKARGTFELKQKVQIWTGVHRDKGKETKLTLRMMFGLGGVYGTGTDTIGFFEITGYFTGENFSFMKRYPGKVSVEEYGGKVTAKSKTSMTIEGRWTFN